MNYAAACWFSALHGYLEEFVMWVDMASQAGKPSQSFTLLLRRRLLQSPLRTGNESSEVTSVKENWRKVGSK